MTGHPLVYVPDLERTAAPPDAHQSTDPFFRDSDGEGARDKDEAQLAADRRAAEALAELVAKVVMPPTVQRIHLRSIGLKIIAIVSLVRPGLFGKNLSEIGRRVAKDNGLSEASTIAILSRYGTHAADTLHVRFEGMRTAQQRAHHAEGRLRFVKGLPPKDSTEDHALTRAEWERRRQKPGCLSAANYVGDKLPDHRDEDSTYE